MPSLDSSASNVVVLGTGGTIAGTAAHALDAVGYTAAQRSARQLLGDLPVDQVLPAGVALEVEQVAQLDSKDMDAATWAALAGRCAHHLSRPEVRGVVVTHGTDTLEETGYLLQRVLAPSKPLVLTAAMRPATALLADGPQNLLDALCVAVLPQARGTVAVLNGQVWAGHELRKRHPFRLAAFGAGDAGPIAVVENGAVRRFRDWPAARPLGLGALPAAPTDWPWVEVITSHAAARPDAARALTAAGVRGLVVAGTGNATVHRALAPALAEAERAGVVVWRLSRCGDGTVVVDASGADEVSGGPMHTEARGPDLGAGTGLTAAESPAAPAAAGPQASAGSAARRPVLPPGLSPWQARVELMLQLARADAGASEAAHGAANSGSAKP
jgi:L-asparaginase